MRKRRLRIIAALLCVYCLALGVRLWWGWSEDHREDWRGRLPGAVANPEAWRLVCEMDASRIPEVAWWVDAQGGEWKALSEGMATSRCNEVDRAYAGLVAQGRAAVPVLLENLDREEVSTYRSDAFHGWGVRYPVSVGNVCMGALVELYDPRSRGMGASFVGIARIDSKGGYLALRSYFDFRAGLCGDDRCRPSEWWERNRHRTDAEIREMVRQWHIARETAFGFESEEEKKRILGEIDEAFSGKAVSGER